MGSWSFLPSLISINIKRSWTRPQVYSQPWKGCYPVFGGSFDINSCFSLGDIPVKLPQTWTRILLKQVSVFKRCQSSDVSFESGKSVK